MSSRSVGEVASTSFVREPRRTGHAEIASKLAHRHGSWRDQGLFPVRDGAVIYLTVVVSLLLFSADISNRESIRPALVALWGSGIFGYALGYSAFVVLVLKWHRYYIPLPVDSLFDETVLVCKCVSISIMVLLSTLYLVGKRVSGARGLLVILVIHVSYLLAARVRRSSRLARGIEAGWLGRNALIVGSGE